MFKATARVHFALAVALSVAQVICGHSVFAQGVRGTVKGRENGRLFDHAQVFAVDSVGREVGSTTTDEQGRFLLRLKSFAKPIIISILRMGIAPTKTDLLTFSERDSSEYEFLVDEVVVRTDTINVRDRVLANERSLRDAKMRGWQLFTPEEVQRHRDTARSLRELVQSMAGLGVIIPNRDGDCFRSTRNNMCLTLVIDGRPVGTTYGIAPAEIYFMALVSKTDAATQWGSENVPNGALVIVTRMHGDRYKY